jgi:hypothetical protein
MNSLLRDLDRRLDLLAIKVGKLLLSFNVLTSYFFFDLCFIKENDFVLLALLLLSAVANALGNKFCSLLNFPLLMAAFSLSDSKSLALSLNCLRTFLTPSMVFLSSLARKSIQDC